MEIVYAADRLFSNRSLSHLSLSIVHKLKLPLCSSLIIHSSRLLVLSPIASKVGVSSSSISKKEVKLEKFLLFTKWGEKGKGKSVTGKIKQDTRFHNEN